MARLSLSRRNSIRKKRIVLYMTWLKMIASVSWFLQMILVLGTRVAFMEGYHKHQKSRMDEKLLTTPGCRSGCAEVRPKDVEEDSLIIAQLLSRSRKIESSGKRNDLDHEHNISSKTETPTKSIFMTEPWELSVRSLSSSENCKNGESPEEPEVGKCAVVSKANHTQVNNDNTELAPEKFQSMLTLSKLKKKVMITMHLHLNYQNWDWRLEMIVEMIKAGKLVPCSREN